MRIFSQFVFGVWSPVIKMHLPNRKKNILRLISIVEQDLWRSVLFSKALRLKFFKDNSCKYFKRNIIKYYGIEMVSNLGAKLWNMLRRQVKNSSSLTIVKIKIRKCLCRTPEKCLCKICQTYIKYIGYIWFLSDTC